MKKQTLLSKSNNQTDHSNDSARRDPISIPMEIDLENRELFFKEAIWRKLNFDLNTNNIDNLMKRFVDPKDLRKVKQLLSLAKKGIEKPISFNFIHPHTAKSHRFEYRYQIEYVKYSSTRLRGVLVNIR
jgi:hypothetical protein